jgi:hypothetical protein
MADVHFAVRHDRNCSCDRRLLTKRELWSIAGEAASRAIATKTTAMQNGHHAATEATKEHGQPTALLSGNASEVAADEVQHQLTGSAQDDDAETQLMHSAAEGGGPGAATAAGAPRRPGGRLLDAGRMFEVAQDPITGCA